VYGSVQQEGLPDHKTDDFQISRMHTRNKDCFAICFMAVKRKLLVRQ